MTRVSIVIPTWDRAGMVGDAIQSVLEQTHPDVECVVVDDGSTDDTPAVLDRFRRWIVTERVPHGGQARAINHGFRIATGELVGVLGSDDILYPTAIEVASAPLDRDPTVAAVHGVVQIVDEQGQPTWRYAVGDLQLVDMLTQAVCPASTGVLYRREAALAIDGWDGSFRYGLDYDFLLRLGLRGSFVFVDHVLGTWRHHEGSISVARSDPRRLAGEYVRIIGGFVARSDLPATFDERVRCEALRTAFCQAGVVAGGDPPNRQGERYRIEDRLAPRLRWASRQPPPDPALTRPGAPRPEMAMTRRMPLAYEDGWADYGDPYTGACFYRDASGVVHLEGLARRLSGSGPLIGQLPVGYRPSGLQLFAQVAGGNRLARVDVDAAGCIRLKEGDPGYVSLSGISFLGEA